MKKTLSVLLALVFTAVFAVSAFAYSTPSTIRVGLVSRYSEASSIPIPDSSVYAGGKYTGEFTLSGSSMKITLPDSYYVYFDRGFTSFSAADNYCLDLESKGYDAAPVYYGEQNFGACIAASGKDGADNAANSLGGTVKSPSNKQMAVKNGNDLILLTEDTIMISAGSKAVTSLGGRTYRGDIEFGRYKGNGITPVNVISPDEYLFGVVGSEMPSSWHGEALKAQAVAARTYAIYNSKKHVTNGYSICDTTDCQAYGGAGAEVESVVDAVKKTSGEIMCYNGEPIQAVFSASSGGYTCSSEDAWVTYMPYLRAVDDSHESSTTWTRTYSAGEIESFLKAKGDNIGAVRNVAVTETGPGGRCLTLTFVGTNGTTSYTKESVRTFFNVSRDGSLPSTMFTINGNGTLSAPKESVYIQNGGSETVSGLNGMYAVTADGVKTINSSSITVLGSENRTHTYGGGQVSGGVSSDYLNQTASTFVFNGKGNGHGVGMSQYGAKALAEKGYTYDKILKYYYAGIEIE